MLVLKQSACHLGRCHVAPLVHDRVQCAKAVVLFQPHVHHFDYARVASGRRPYVKLVMYTTATNHNVFFNHLCRVVLGVALLAQRSSR